MSLAFLFCAGTQAAQGEELKPHEISYQQTELKRCKDGPEEAPVRLLRVKTSPPDVQKTHPEKWRRLKARLLDQAVSKLREVAKQYPYSMSARLGVVRLLPQLDEGHYDAALAAAIEAVNLDLGGCEFADDAQRQEVWNTVIDILLRQDRHGEALGWALVFYQQAPDLYAADFRLARVHCDFGDKEKCASYLRGVVERLPDHESASGAPDHCEVKERFDAAATDASYDVLRQNNDWEDLLEKVLCAD